VLFLKYFLGVNDLFFAIIFFSLNLYNDHINSMGGGVSTALTISAEEILINGISFDNR
jgi:hypothetical protein